MLTRLLLLLALPLLAVCQLLSSEDEARARACPSYELITTRGANDTYPDSFWLAPLTTTFRTQHPDVRHTETRYNASVGYGEELGHVRDGSAWLRDYTALLAASCPRTKIATMGYSLGAAVTVVAQTRVGFPLDRVSANVLWGSPLYTGGRPENRGSAQNAIGMYALTGFRTPRGLANVTMDVCDA